jgi:sugar lactone lactonase YvrE
MKPILDISKASVYFDGIFSSPRLQHPEGVAIDNNGLICCGTENGEIMRISKDKSSMECLANSGGFILGIAIDNQNNIFACEMKEAALFKYDSVSKSFNQFAKGPKIPNYPVIDQKRNCIYVSDSFGFNEKGVGIYKFDLTSGKGGPCSEELFNFANGMCLSPNGDYLYVVESFHPCISRLPINGDGKFGKKEIFTEDIATVPDGLAFDKQDNLFISCYEPSRIYISDSKGSTRLLIEDEHCTTLAHPTNISLSEDGKTMYTANLGRWHITEIDISSLYN